VPVAAVSLALATLLAQAPPAFTVSVGHRAEQVTYHFANDSAFDATGLVPHYFEQHYTSGPLWITFDGRYSLGGTRAKTSVSFAPRTQTEGSDLDTFFLPSGDVVTAGTDGQVMLSSFAIRQDLQLHAWSAWTMALSIGYRRSTADFLPDDRIVVHTQPPSVTRTFITDRETTISEVFDTGVMAATERRLSDRWTMAVEASASPLTRARLTTRLPDKYPGQDIVFSAIAFGVTGNVSVSRAWTHVSAGINFDAGFTRGYQQASDYRQHAIVVSAFARLK
jgi:hypothetical protein